MESPVRVLVTGGLGFIGRACVPRLLERDCRAVVVDSLHEAVHGTDPDPGNYSREWSGDFEVMLGSVTDAPLMRRLVESVDSVIHLAALTSVPASMRRRAEYTEANITGTAVLCDAVAESPGVKRIVLASSRAVYGEGPYRCPRSCAGTLSNGFVRGLTEFERGDWDPRCPACGEVLQHVACGEDSPLRPVSFYGVTKVAQEQLIRQLLPFSDATAAILRLQNVYGPGPSRDVPDVGVANILAQQALRGEGLSLFEDGGPSRDFVYIDDVADLIVHAALNRFTDATCEVFNVGTGQATSLRQLVELIKGEIRNGVPARVTGEYRLGDIRHSAADTRRLAKHYAWSPVPVDEGMRRLIGWLRA